MEIKGKKVFVGISGGVDSSVSAALLKDQGYDVTGVFIRVWQPPFLECSIKDDRRDAMRVCAQLDIPFIECDAEDAYKKEVIDYMMGEYRKGRTPNPDVMCNKYVKFGIFFNWAMQNGADYVATGHYAQVEKILANGDGVRFLKGKDEKKDQSYFLWAVGPEKLSKTLFPIGNLEKDEVRKLAKKFGLFTAEKKDSQGLCFLGKLDVKDFLKKFIDSKKGNVLNEAGEVIGEHEGAFFFTLGERHGFKILKKTSEDDALYVLSKNVENNTITVGPRFAPENNTNSHDQDNSGKNISLQDIVFYNKEKLFDKNMLSKIKAVYRYHGEEIEIEKIIEEVSGVETRNGLWIGLKESKADIASGQSMVLYCDNEVLAGGSIFLS
jgi:tRNA-specific 2-thiouridylase